MAGKQIQNPNLEILLYVVDQLGELANEMVFLGGSATGILITDPAAPPVRVTKDVDAIVQVTSRTEYYRLAEKLKAKGFREDTSEDAPICRWRYENVILDVMPTDARILGFGNDWYEEAMTKAQEVKLSSGKQIKMVSAPYFLITKLEAFKGRGKGDYFASHDMEDVIIIIDGRPEIVDEVRQSSPELRKTIGEWFQKLLGDDRFVDSIDGHLPDAAVNQARKPLIRERLEALASISSE